MKLLVMDDDLDFGLLVAEVAQGLGITCQVEVDPRNFAMAMRLMQPDAVVLDIFMPDIDGIELIAQMQAPEPKPDRPLDLLLVSGAAVPCLEAADKMARIKPWLRPAKAEKPVNLEMLHHYFQTLLTERGERASAS